MLYSSQEEQILEEICELDYIPPPNPVLLQLLDMLQRQDSTFEHLTETISKDSALTSQILRMANSAYYGMRSQISSLDRAVTILGVAEIRNLAIVLCVVKEMRPRRMPLLFDLEAYWVHSLLTAMVARAMTDSIQGMKPDMAYLMGLLHNLGILVLAVARPDKYDQIARLARDQDIPMTEAEVRLNIRHTALGHATAKSWNFPPALSTVMGYHHSSLHAPKFRRESSLVELSAMTAEEALKERWDASEALAASPVATSLGLDATCFRKILDDVRLKKEEIEEMAALFVA